MNTETSNPVESYPNMDKIKNIASLHPRLYAYTSLFPNTVFSESGLGVMCQCIGFLMGQWSAGRQKEAEVLAKSLLNAFRLGMDNDTREAYFGDPMHHPHKNKLFVFSDGTFMGFSFLYMNIDPDQTATRLDYVDKTTYGLFEFSKEYRYLKQFNGGILFHGLQQVYSVNLNGGNGWSMHT